MGRFGSVELLLKRAVRTDRTAITDIWGFLELPAFILFEFITECITHAAVFTEFDFFCRITRSAKKHSWDFAGIAVDAGIIAEPEGAGLFSE